MAIAYIPLNNDNLHLPPMALAPPPHHSHPHQWSSWRQPKHIHLFTPPHRPTSHSSTPVTTTLPPIAQLDLRLPIVHPPTPPSSTYLHTSSPPPLPLPSPPPPPQAHVEHEPHTGSCTVVEPPPPPQPEAMTTTATTATTARFLDWLDMSRQQSAAEKTCEMICYLWFSTRSPSVSSSSSAQPRSPASTHQLVASPLFINFMRKVLETTQVSASVVVLALHFIYRLKARSWGTPAAGTSGNAAAAVPPPPPPAAPQPGSEFRIAVAALMMANKFLDDNTYTNRTWSDVSGIALAEINRMEREFLAGVDFALFVGAGTYGSWLHLLKGLVSAKERESARCWGRAHHHHHHHHHLHRHSAARKHYRSLPSPQPTPAPSSSSSQYHYHRVRSSHYPYYSRARSSSPNRSTVCARQPTYPFTFSTGAPYNAYHTQQQPPPPQLPPLPHQLPSPHSPPLPPANTTTTTTTTTIPAATTTGSKRPASCAFSPTSESFAQHARPPPGKRAPPVALSLEIPTARSRAGGGGSASGSAVEGLQSFARMTLSATSASSSSSSSVSSDGESVASSSGGSPPPVRGWDTSPAQPAPVAAATAAAAARVPSPVSPAPQVSASAPVPVPTLVSAYRMDERRSAAVPQTLYFYSLACSPPDGGSDGRGGAEPASASASASAGATDGPRGGVVRHKARLRYHQPAVHQPRLAASSMPPRYFCSSSGGSGGSGVGAGHTNGQVFENGYGGAPVSVAASAYGGGRGGYAAAAAAGGGYGYGYGYGYNAFGGGQTTQMPMPMVLPLPLPPLPLLRPTNAQSARSSPLWEPSLHYPQPYLQQQQQQHGAGAFGQGPSSQLPFGTAGWVGQQQQQQQRRVLPPPITTTTYLQPLHAQQQQQQQQQYTSSPTPTALDATSDRDASMSPPQPQPYSHAGTGGDALVAPTPAPFANAGPPGVRFFALEPPPSFSLAALHAPHHVHHHQHPHHPHPHQHQHHQHHQHSYSQSHAQHPYHPLQHQHRGAAAAAAVQQGPQQYYGLYAGC